jgi:hypothetical protein
MSNAGEPIVPSGEPVAGPTVTYREPDDYAELRGVAARYNELTEILGTDLDLIRDIVSDEDTRTFTRSAIKTYRDRQRDAEPQIGAEFQPVVKHFEEKWSPVVEYVNELRTERETAKADKERAEKEEQQRGFAANKAYAERIMAEREDFRTADGHPSPMMEDLIILAAQRKLSIEDAYKEYGPRYFGVRPTVVREPSERRAPSSLRSGDPGVPGESAQPKPQTQKERLARMRQNMIAANGRGA